MADIQPLEGLQEEKLRLEVDKLRQEVVNLRRPFRHPTTLTAILVAAATAAAAGFQFKLNEIRAERTRLEIETLDKARTSIQHEVQDLDSQRAQLASEAAAGSTLLASVQQRLGDAQKQLVALETSLQTGGVTQGQIQDVRDSVKALRTVAVTSQDSATSLDLTRREFEAPRRSRPTGILGPYKVGIYYLQHDSNAQTFAKQVQRALSKSVSVVQYYARDESFFESVVPPEGDEIRFEEDAESSAAQELRGLLRSRLPDHEFRLQPVLAFPTPKFLSIFIDHR
jgi:hypothetical protein